MKTLKTIIALAIITSQVHINAYPNTLVACQTDNDCQKYAKDNGQACKKQPDYNAPTPKCKSTTLLGREVKYCVCEYANKNPKVTDKFIEGMQALYGGCGNEQSCHQMGAACASGALPQCDAAEGGVCYCPF